MQRGTYLLGKLCFHGSSESRSGGEETWFDDCRGSPRQGIGFPGSGRNDFAQSMISLYMILFRKYVSAILVLFGLSLAGVVI